MMKSIVEEASTLERAIAQAWKRAGSPKKFTITIFQEAEKNFFGMTTLPAKIGFMYEEAIATHQKTQKRAPERTVEKPQQEVQVQPRKPVIKSQRPALQEEPQLEQAEKKDSGRFWAPEMIDAAEQWLKEVLSIAGKPHSSFSIKASRYHLKIQFNEPVFADQKREKAFFRSCALLIMQAQRATFKKSLKFHKVILISN